MVNETIIHSYFRGETTPEQEKEILEWLESSEDNRREFFEMQAVWNARNVLQEGNDLVGFASFLRETHKRIDQMDAQENTRKRGLSVSRRKLWRSVVSVAASVALILGVGLVWRLMSDSGVYKVYENDTDSIITFSLSDGSQVWLNARTRLVLPEKFSATARNVELDGAAFFDVEPDAGAPFIVHTRTLMVHVLGTAFSVKSYEESNVAEVVLERGSVRLRTPEGVNLVKLHPDQCATYDATNDNLEITQVNASLMVLSQYDLITMENVTLHEIISRIEVTYGVRIAVEGRYDSKRYTFNLLRSNTLEEALNIVEYMTGEKCKIIYRKKP